MSVDGGVGVNGVRWWLGALRRAVFPPAAEADWRRAHTEGRRAAARGVRVGGRRRMGAWDLEYPDIAALASQWEDLVMRDALGWRALGPAPVILDVGANVGLAALVLAQRAPDARVTAFEADPTLAAMCRRNLERNGSRAVQVEAAAVWTHDGRIPFALEGADSGAIATLPGALDATTATVPCVRLRDRLAAGPVDLLKLDIEGAEADVLEDCREVLPQVRAVLVEVHDFHAYGAQLLRVLQVLRTSGFVVAVDQALPIADRTPPHPHGGFAVSASYITRVKAWRP